MAVDARRRALLRRVGTAAGAGFLPMMRWRCYETPHFDTVTLGFGRHGVTFLNSLTQMLNARTRA